MPGERVCKAKLHAKLHQLLEPRTLRRRKLLRRKEYSGGDLPQSYSANAARADDSSA
jgi:hypothetical protein